MGLTVGRGVAGAGSSSVEAPPHHANISPGLETALFYGLIMTRRAARLGLHRARNVERDDARDLARCALTNPGRDVCWSGDDVTRSAVEIAAASLLPGTWEPWTRTSACQRLCKCSSGGKVQRRKSPRSSCSRVAKYARRRFTLFYLLLAVRGTSANPEPRSAGSRA